MTIHIEGGLEPYVKIKPKLVKFNDSEMAEALFVAIIYDDCYSFCTLRYKLGTLVPLVDEEDNFLNNKSTILFQGEEIISGEDYANWNNNNNFPFEYILSHLPIEIVE